jgi:hypothetical protein
MQVRPGMEVIGTTGAPVGRVVEVQDDDFLVERTPAGGSVRLGYDTVRALLGSQVVLSIGPDQLDERAS